MPSPSTTPSSRPWPHAHAPSPSLGTSPRTPTNGLITRQALDLVVVVARDRSSLAAGSAAPSIDQRGRRVEPRARAPPRGRAALATAPRAGGLQRAVAAPAAAARRAGTRASRSHDRRARRTRTTKPAGVRELAEHGRLDLAPRGEREERVELVRRHRERHALLRLGEEDLPRREARVLERRAGEVDARAAGQASAISPTRDDSPPAPLSVMPL